MTFDMQWRHVIDIPRDLFLKPAEKVQPFSFFFFFFSSTTFSDGLPLIHVYHSATVRNMIRLIFISHMMVDRSSLCYF